MGFSPLIVNNSLPRMNFSPRVSKNLKIKKKSLKCVKRQQSVFDWPIFLLLPEYLKEIEEYNINLSKIYMVTTTLI